MIEISSSAENLSDEKRLVSAQTILSILENNRARIRSLNGSVLTICGLLLSTSFVVTIFILDNSTFSIHWTVPIFLFITLIGLTISIVFSLWSILMPNPIVTPTNLELINHLTSIYHREYRLALISVILLLISIIFFVAAISIFGFTLL